MTTTSATASLPTTYVPTTSSTTASGSSSATPTNAAEAQDRFLKLLVAQMSNQDPMNPMDNAQMTSQIAQINTVSGIQQLNDTMKNMTSQMSAMQALTASNLVGHGVLSAGNQLTFSTDGATAVGAVQLDAAATDVKVQVSTAGGQILDTISLGALGTGQHGFQLDSSAYPTNTQLRFTVTATNAGKEVTATPLMRDTVAGVSTGTDGTLMLNLVNGGSTPYSSVRSVL